ncbi:hypothetical protein SAMN05443144_10131 [Fodinibius roseus]|uniref:Uncharacterized protein n=1 Tax=Fodinibius roseus TaxID=1194090 RepID=A0A1M4SGK1_9BACT|nr:hypothetical protein [Fodinibius roseus]SHE31330.1 hypothetical protein SAMN05443144_10131 [Fodinibius roseus]
MKVFEKIEPILRKKSPIFTGIFVFVIFFVSTTFVSDVINLKLYTLDNLNRTTFPDDQKQYELAFIYIGCSTCSAANIEGLPSAIDIIKKNLKENASLYEYGFRTIGISKDYINTEGLVHLAKYGNFDEVMTGNGWSNTGILKYIYTDIPGKAAIPQILVTRRKFREIVNNNIAAYRGIEKEVLLIRKVGTRDIIKWANQNAFLPESSLDF